MNAVLLKLGGSLLDLPDLADRILAVIHSEHIDRAVILVGGGPAADLVRQYDQQFCLSEFASHRLAIQAMSLNSHLLSELNSGFTLIGDPLAVNRRFDSAAVLVLEPAQFIKTLELTDSADVLLPSWDTTSDSIAAWICQRLKISRLVLLKSTALSPELLKCRGDCMHELQNRQLVDANFAKAVRNISRIQWCNLRSAEPATTLTSLR